ncbi:MAG: hypothetical protein QOE36_3194, partial [Gaiellaceae bacterium]|nr:hypothetical protein [Gaiellaceae bacterium]
EVDGGEVRAYEGGYTAWAERRRAAAQPASASQL